MRLQGKTAIVTGGGSGIGRATVLLFAEEGANVVVAGLPFDACEAVAREVSAKGGAAIAVRTDVSSAIDVDATVQQAVRNFGGVDILFNNAGVGDDSYVTDTGEDEWNRVIDICLKGVFLGCKFTIPVMERRGGGSIINSASVAAFIGLIRRPAYSAAKGGVIAMTRAIAMECAPYNIRVNSIAPGPTDTPMVREMYESSGDPAEAQRRHAAAIPFGRLTTPEEMARSVLFLASDDSPTVTGSCLVVDGGYSSLRSNNVSMQTVSSEVNKPETVA